MVAKVRKRVAQVRICGGVPTGVLRGHALRLSNERLQVVDADGTVHSKPMRTISEMAICPFTVWEVLPQRFVLSLFFAGDNFDPKRQAKKMRKCLYRQNLAEREGFEPSIQVLARITV